MVVGEPLDVTKPLAVGAEAEVVKEGGLSKQARVHYDKRQAAIKKYPHVRELTGADPSQFIYILLILALHWSVAYSLRDAEVRCLK